MPSMMSKLPTSTSITPANVIQPDRGVVIVGALYPRAASTSVPPCSSAVSRRSCGRAPRGSSSRSDENADDLGASSDRHAPSAPCRGARERLLPRHRPPRRRRRPTLALGGPGGDRPLHAGACLRRVVLPVLHAPDRRRPPLPDRVARRPGPLRRLRRSAPRGLRRVPPRHLALPLPDGDRGPVRVPLDAVGGRRPPSLRVARGGGGRALLARRGRRVGPARRAQALRRRRLTTSPARAPRSSHSRKAAQP